MENTYSQIRKLLYANLKAFTCVWIAIFTVGQVWGQADLSLSSQNSSGIYTATNSITLTNGFSSLPGGTFTAGIVSHVPLNSTPSNDQNYVIINVPRIPITDITLLSSRDVNEVSQQVQYMDGLGRLLQSVQVKGSPTLSDVVQPVAYDAMGRQAQTFLPYTSSASTSGSYRSDALSGTAGYSNSGQYLFYQNNIQTIESISNPYSQSVYELSPLGRVVEQGMPGATWQTGGGHSVKTAFGTNTDNEVFLWKVSGNGASHSSAYSAGKLYTATTTDENGRTSTTYTDFSGNVVCRKVQYTTGFIYAYYIYDDIGNLRYVIPPLPTVPAPVTIPASFTETDNIFNNFFYGYHYDGRNRPVEKKIPGKGWEYSVYNKLDQIVLSQTPAQLSLGLWTFFKFDASGRTVMTGNYSSALSRAALQTQQDSFGNIFWESFTNATTNFGYTNNSYPDISNNAANKPLTINYYDSYNFISNNSINPNSAVFTAPSASVDTICQQPIGALTGSLTNVVGSPSTTYLLGLTHYDTFGRSVETLTQTYLNGAANGNQYDFLTSQYSFNDLPTQTVKRHFLSSGLKLTILTRNSYDNAGRKTLLQQQYSTSGNPGSLITLAQYRYNESGQIITKHLHNTTANLSPAAFLQHLDYRYNSRGWQTRLNTPASLTDETFAGQNDVFAEQLDYDKPNTSFTGTPAQFNGNVSTTTTQALVKPGSGMTQEIRGYAFQYDPLSRITSTAFKAASGNDKYNETLTYDELGNVLTLNRNSSSSSYLNKLSYDYGSGAQRGNLLLGVQDNGGSEGYTSTYSYWPSGSQKSDSKLAITNTSYNELNLPSVITVSGGKTISFIYSASGEKLERIIKQGTSVSEDRSYLNGTEYVGGTIEYVHSPEGRAIPVGTGFTLQYQITDHLGNTRAVIDDADGNGIFSANDILQSTDYYTFGRQSATYETNPPLQYKFNGKEYSTDLNAYDYGARYYNPVIARWNSPDGMAEKSRKWSPYTYAYNNPVKNVDPDGNFSYDFSTAYANAVSSTLSQIVYNGISNEPAIAEVPTDNTVNGEPMREFLRFMQGNGGGNNGGSRGFGGSGGSGGGDFYNTLNSSGGSSPLNWEGMGNLLTHLTPFGGIVDFANAAKANDVGGAILGLANSAGFFLGELAEPTYPVAYRGLNATNVESINAGLGIFAKGPEGNWSLEQHLISGSSYNAIGNDPFIPITTDYNVAVGFNQRDHLGIVTINLNKLPSNSMLVGWEEYDRTSAAYHYSIWQQEISVYQNIPQSAIVSWNKNAP